MKWNHHILGLELLLPLLVEELLLLGIIGSQLRTTLKPLGAIYSNDVRRLTGAKHIRKVVNISADCCRKNFRRVRKKKKHTRKLQTCQSTPKSSPIPTLYIIAIQRNGAICDSSSHRNAKYDSYMFLCSEYKNVRNIESRIFILRLENNF